MFRGDRRTNGMLNQTLESIDSGAGVVSEARGRVFGEDDTGVDSDEVAELRAPHYSMSAACASQVCRDYPAQLSTRMRLSAISAGRAVSPAVEFVFSCP